MQTLWRITAPHFVAGLIVRQGIVTETAPILAWAVGKPWADIKRYMAGKGWSGSVCGRKG